MRVTIFPSKASGVVSAPPSKSIAHRALICGALTERCTIHNCGQSQDIQATLRCLEALGASVEMQGDTIIIGGLDPYKLPEHPLLDCGESGSTLRFLLPLCLLSCQEVTLIGHGRLMERPLGVYESLCRERGFTFEQVGNTLKVCGKLKSGTYTVDGNVSSQFITGLLLALTQVHGKSRVEVVNQLESASYVNITTDVLSAFACPIERADNAFIVPKCAKLTLDEYTIDGDCSNAAFLDAYNLLNGSVKVMNLSPETPQGDWVYKQMYCDLSMGKREFDLSDCPDLGPVMFALSAVCGGARFTGTARLRIKESDRCAAMAEELAKFGVKTEIGDNFVTIFPAKLSKPSEVLYGHNDHRIVMALSLLCSVTGGSIEGAQAVAKSYPDYFRVIRSLGIELITDDIW